MIVVEAGYPTRLGYKKEPVEMSEYNAKILVAAPMLGDPNFRQSVVLMLNGTDEDAFGVIINRKSDKPISEVWETIFGQPCEINQMIYLGGPVFGPLIAVHTQKDVADAEIMPGLYFSTQKEALENLIESKRMPFRLYIGGSGWGKGQLADEIEKGAWYMMPANAIDVFDDPTEIWKKSLDKAGRIFLQAMIGRITLPEDPICN